MKSFGSLPLEHLDRMTDSTGLIQHGIYSLPRRESGYTTDDNARALRLCARLWNTQPNDRILSRVACYLSFIEHARCPVRGFHNFLSYQRDWLDATGTGDCQGQAVLALAEVVGSNLPEGFRALASELLENALPTLESLRSLRAQAYVIQAWAHLRRSDVPGIEPLEGIAKLAAERLVECFHRSQRPGWPWFESRMTYANAVLPHALFDAAQRWPEEEYLSVAETSFSFLDFATTSNLVFHPIGNRDWYSHGEEKSLYDQQPVEASTMASAALAAMTVLEDERYQAVFHRARDWFHGQNSLKTPLADIHSGGCFDGLHPTGPNRNQGAESTLAFLWTELHVDGVASINHTREVSNSTNR
ncbi:hypothetical protein [Bremerella cremea]|uniref:hypothetical protein n=1 Tax=Bremerella cremea TaxID=1031537 RepID=UPI0031E833D3